MSSGASGGSSSGAVAPAGQPIELQKINNTNGGGTKTINVGAKDMSAQPGSVGMGPVAVKANGAAAPVAHPVRVEDRTFSVAGGKATFPLNDKGRSPEYATSTNCVISSKYTLLTFLPKNLFEQFSNLANLYFLLVGVFQIIPQFSTTDGNPTMYQPLAFIVFVSALRAAKEDYDMHKADAQRNGFHYSVLRGNEGFKSIESGDIRVGDIVKVGQNNMIPADMLFLGSALAKGHCFIDKSNLNGETTLEVMNSMVQTKPLCVNEKDLEKLSLTLTYEAPNKRFDSLKGSISGLGDDFNVDGKSLIMRETNLRNCDYIYGLVIYTGNDTKIQRSNLEGEKPKTKVSYIMRQVNTYLIYMLLLQSILCLVGGILAGAFRSGFTSEMWFLSFNQPGFAAPSPGATGVFAFFSWFILLSQMVPISLIVSAELVKFVQSLFIEQDLQLYYEKLNKPTKCNSSTIHEDLGLIDYVFSDKTGTLTQNKMEFRYLSLIAGEFGSKETDIAKSVKTRQQALADKLAGRPVSGHTLSWTQMVAPHLAPKDPKIDKPYCCTQGWFSDNCWSSPKSAQTEEEEVAPLVKNEFTDEERLVMWQRLWGPTPKGESKEDNARKRAALRRYMVHMALSNTVKPYEDAGVMKFQAESAEELAMATFSRKCGFFKKQINPTVLEITEYDENLKEKPQKVIETYNHVATFGFTSKRARVTVVYQRVDGDKKCHVMMKGQDTVALPLIALGDTDEDELLENLKNMSTNGLRTLVCGFAELEPSWWSQRAAAYQEIITRDSSPASEGHPAKCKPVGCEKCAQHEFFEQVEKDAGLQYAGCIGLEDQLQLLVPECIGDCIRGGIKVWMITGDKLETAKNIGLACNLIDPDMIPSFTSGDVETVVQEFQRARLVEITGAWASMSQSDEDLGKIFDVFDKDRNDELNVEELHYILTALRCNLTEEKLRQIIIEHNASSPDLRARGGDSHKLDREGFMHLLKSTQMSKFDAVWFDIEEGIKTFNAIANHDQYPVSLLIDRAAFQVLFPGKAGATPSAADLASLGPGVTLKKLNIMREMFFQIAGRSKSVPAMKKRMVTEIQARVTGALTLAIGDGANDTDMITAAHIGVGIAGVEGTAATNAADYAIGTFRMLHSLLFVHGFYSYQRTSKLVNFIFYKASLVAVMMFLFGFYSAMSGQQFFNDAPYQLYNVMYTALPILCVAVFDKPLPAQFLQDNPRLYLLQKHTAFDPMIFSGWIFRAFLHGIVIFFIPYFSFGTQNISQTGGRADGIWYFSTCVYYCTVMTPTLLIMFDMNNVTFLHWVSIACSVASLFIVTWIMNYLTKLVPDLDGVINTMYSNWSFWMVLIVTVSACMVLELIWRAWMRELYPTVVQIHQEINRMSPAEQKQALDPANLVAPQPPPSAGVRGGASGNGSATNAVPTSDDHIHVEYSQSHAPDGTLSARGKSQGGLDRRNSVSQRESARGRDKLKNNMNMTGAQFDSAAQAQLQQHDRTLRYDAEGKEVRSPNDGSASSSSAYPQLAKQGAAQSEEKSVPSPTNASHGVSASSQLAPPTPDAGLNASSMQLLNKYDADPAHDANGDSHARPAAADHDEDTEPKTTDRRL